MQHFAATSPHLIGLRGDEHLASRARVLDAGWMGRNVLCLLVLVVSCNSSQSSDSGKQRPDTPEGRREMVRIISKDMPADSMWTEGARSEGLVFDMKDCTKRTLSQLAQEKVLANRLHQFDFQYIKCANGVRVDGPRVHD